MNNKARSANKNAFAASELISALQSLLSKHYQPQKHHAACILQCGKNRYFSLHLDCKGFDYCAEPGAISQAILAGEKRFDIIIAGAIVNDSFQVISPCGNCRQLLLNFCPQIEVIIPNRNSTSSTSAVNLLPHPYK